MTNDKNSLIYWLGGGLLVALVLVAISLWTPTTGPQDIMPAAGSAAYDSSATSTRSGTTADDMNNSGAVGGTTTTTPTGGPVNSYDSTPDTE